MIHYTDGKWIATFDERGALVKFEETAHAHPGAMIEAIRGKAGKKMIAEIRTPRLRRDLDGKMKVTVPV